MPFPDRWAFQITQLATQAQRPLLVVTQHNRAVQRLKQLIQFFNPDIPILTFPDWETLPYERLSPPLTQTTQRIHTLSQLGHYAQGIILTTATAISQKIAPKEYIDGYAFTFSIHGKIELSLLKEQLIRAGYQRVTTVTLPGEFAIKGELVNIFPLDSHLPFRIHIHVDRIENLYYFDPETQTPSEAITKIELLPIREFLLSETSLTRFRDQGKKRFGAQFLESTLNQQLTTTSYAAGTEYFLPLFFEKTNTLLDYLPRHTHWVTHLDLHMTCTKIKDYVTARYEQLNHDAFWPLLPYQDLYQAPNQWITHLQSFKATEPNTALVTPLPALHQDNTVSGLPTLRNLLDQASKSPSKRPIKVLFCTNRHSQQALLLTQLKTIGITPQFTDSWADFLTKEDTYQVGIAPIKEGFIIQSDSVLIIPENAIQSVLLKETPTKGNHPLKPKPLDTFHHLDQLTTGDYVVHIDHGIGRYLGLQSLTASDAPEEFIVLAYAEDTKLYVPIKDIQYISRYAGHANPALHALNSKQWKKTKQQAFTQLKDTAAELLSIYAEREYSQGEALNTPNAEYQRFAETFAFEATPDQNQAIFDVIHDLCQKKPMDRLICGDVGFGKTEVAMRAAFLAIQSGKQVALLSPTTLLVDQHYRTFKERFSDWPITIEWVSRFRTTKDIRAVKQSLAEGKIDIIIGTHALLSHTTTFQNLGLLIIDEEHHFGVQQKEKIKRFKKAVHVLTLTATPIPRTLQTALSGLRPLSLITTPPIGRLAIKNFIRRREPHCIQEAIARELLRGGQVYFVHNRIASIERVKREIQRLSPEARIGIAHGQLSEEALEHCMQAFYQQQYNVLLCTSIIETGLDIPTVNTLIVDRADHFGLAQLHQLRGRVGRSHHQAYAYFLVSDEKQITSDAKKRLKALHQFTQLGAGFNLASQDLDIRGAGELLGERQSGAIQGIGFSLYMELLEKTIDAMQHNPSFESLEQLPSLAMVDVKIPAFIPEYYIPDVTIRLQYYKRMAHSATQETLNQIQIELLDQYGLLPDAAQNLFALNRLQKIVTPLGIAKIEGTSQNGCFTFYENTSIHPLRVIQLVQQSPEQFSLVPNSNGTPPRLRFCWQADSNPKQRIAQIEAILEQIR